MQPTTRGAPLPSLETAAQASSSIEEADVVGETATLNPSECATADQRELYPALRHIWLQNSALRTLNKWLEEIWLPLIIDGAILISEPSEPEVRWQRPEGLQPLFAGQTLTTAHARTIIRRLVSNSVIAHFLLLVLALEEQHKQISVAYTERQLGNLIQQNFDLADILLDWLSILENNFHAALCIHQLTRRHICLERQLLIIQQRQQIQRRLLPNQAVETAPPSPLFVLFTTSRVHVVQFRSGETAFENEVQAAWSNLEGLDARATAAFQAIEENGETIRNELRAGLTDIPRQVDLLQHPQHPQPVDTTIDGSLDEENLQQDREPAHGESLMPDSLLQPRCVNVSGQPGLLDVQQHQLSRRIPNPLLQQAPIIRPLGEQPSHTTVRPVHPVRRYIPLSHWERIGRLGQSQTTYGNAISELNYRIENIQILQEELLQAFDRVLPRSKTRIARTTRLLEPLMGEEYQRLHGRRANVAPYHIEMHEFSLRERIIVVDRNLWPSAVTMSRMNQLEIWLQALRSDFIFAARLYGPDKPIKRTWAYPAWPAEIESLSMQTITREVDGKLTDIVIIGFDPVM